MLLPSRTAYPAFLLMHVCLYLPLYVLVSCFVLQGDQGLPGPRGPSGAVGEPGKIVSHPGAFV